MKWWVHKQLKPLQCTKGLCGSSFTGLVRPVWSRTVKRGRCHTSYHWGRTRVKSNLQHRSWMLHFTNFMTPLHFLCSCSPELKGVSEPASLNCPCVCLFPVKDWTPSPGCFSVVCPVHAGSYPEKEGGAVLRRDASQVAPEKNRSQLLVFWSQLWHIYFWQEINTCESFISKVNSLQSSMCESGQTKTLFWKERGSLNPRLLLPERQKTVTNTHHLNIPDHCEKLDNSNHLCAQFFIYF